MSCNIYVEICCRLIGLSSHTCDKCKRAIEITRYICLMCTEPAKLLSRRTVDFCGDCVDKGSSKKDGSTSWTHLPDHNILQTRTGIHSRKYVLASDKLDLVRGLLSYAAPGELHCSSCRASVASPVWACVTCAGMPRHITLKLMF